MRRCLRPLGDLAAPEEVEPFCNFGAHPRRGWSRLKPLIPPRNFASRFRVHGNKIGAMLFSCIWIGLTEDECFAIANSSLGRPCAEPLRWVRVFRVLRPKARLTGRWMFPRRWCLIFPTFPAT